MPDLGLTPMIEALGPAAIANATPFTDAFDAGLLAGLPSGVTYFAFGL